jgi:hypothetical protein
VVVAEQAAEALARDHVASLGAVDLDRSDQLVAEALVRALRVVMGEVIRDGAVERLASEEDEPVEALGLRG